MLGTCLCGSVQIQLDTQLDQLVVCHCAMCRKWGGGASFNLNVDGAFTVALEAALISRYQSSAWAARCFCQKCGTHLYYQLLDAQKWSVNAELFDLPATAKINLEIYTDAKPDYYSYFSTAQHMTEQQVIDAYATSTTKK